MNRSEFRFAERLRVRWAEVDLQQIVFNGHYLLYVDTAMAGYWRTLALPYQDTFAALGGDLFVRKATVEFHAPAHYDDLLEIGLRLAHVGTTSLRFSAGVFHEHRLLVSAELVYVYADPATKTPTGLPEALVGPMKAFEAGEAMVRVETGSWAALGARAQPVRTAVFVQEQGISAALEYDDADAGAVHAIAVNRLGRTLATGRLLQTGVAGSSKIGRMAVERAVRGSRVGRQVLDALVAAARARGDREVVLHAQTSAAGFYERAGFRARGPGFEEAGIPHVEMVRALSDPAA